MLLSSPNWAPRQPADRGAASALGAILTDFMFHSCVVGRLVVRRHFERGGSKSGDGDGPRWADPDTLSNFVTRQRLPSGK